MTDQRPAIAVLTQITGASYGYWNQPTLVLPAAYCIELQRAGAIALALSPDEYLVDHPDELLDRVDGLILSGGGDIDPAAFALAAAYTPVPGGVGALTIAMLMQNTVTAAKARRGARMHSEAALGRE